MPEQWPNVIRICSDVLSRLGVQQLTTMHGWTTSTFEDAAEFEALQWTETGLRLEEVLAFLEQRRTLGFTLGQDDWWLGGTAACGFSLLCCHEGDLHLNTNDLMLAARLTDGLAQLDISLGAVDG